MTFAKIEKISDECDVDRVERAMAEMGFPRRRLLTPGEKWKKWIRDTAAAVRRSHGENLHDDDEEFADALQAIFAEPDTARVLAELVFADAKCEYDGE